MRYVDFDGVILDTEELLFGSLRKLPNYDDLKEEDIVKYLQDINWRNILNSSSVINDSLYILKNSSIDDFIILTKIHSVDNEGIEKVRYLRENGIKQNIILVPYKAKKSDVVNAKGNILIDDCLKNLSEWQQDNGYPMFFDKNDTNIDSWNVPNTFGYQRVKKIDEELL